MADGYIGSFDTKYHYRFWRPVTAIRLADIDDNPATTADPTWTPLCRPTHPGLRLRARRPRRSRGGGPEAVFKTDEVSFSACSFTLPAGQTCSDASPTLRHFTSFSQAAAENAVSRIYVGFPLPRRGRDGDEGTARRSATVPSTTSYDPCTTEAMTVGGPSFGRARPAS